MNKTPTIQPWRIVAAEIIAATKADPDSLRSIYEDSEFRPARNASVWSQLSARLAQARKAYREAVAGGYLKECSTRCCAAALLMTIASQGHIWSRWLCPNVARTPLAW